MKKQTEKQLDWVTDTLGWWEAHPWDSGVGSQWDMDTAEVIDRYNTQTTTRTSLRYIDRMAS